MTEMPADSSAGLLPSMLPIFPLPGVLLLPRGRLPLHIFEPRYVAMVEASLFGDRMIGMVQPVDPDHRDQTPVVYPTGCAGRITAFRDLEDGRYLITLTGVSRFRILEELPPLNGFRRVVPDWDDFREDVRDDPGHGGGFDRGRLLGVLPCFLDVNEIAADWETIEGAPDERLVTSLAMICPFRSNEKQALLEARTLADRASLLTALIEMALVDSHGGETRPCH